MSDNDLIRRGDALKTADEELRRYGFSAPEGRRYDMRDAIAALPAVTVGVRPLVWVEGVSTYPYAMGGRVRYQLGHGDDGWTVHIGIAGKPIAGPFETAEAAKAAAQADFDAAIRGEVILTPAPDAAAIRAAALREAAGVADKMSIKWWSEYKDRMSDHCADPHYQGMSDGADEVGQAILALIGKEGV